MKRTIVQLFDDAERYRNLAGLDPGDDWKERHPDHRGILDACVERDAPLAEWRLVENYGAAASLIFRELGGDYDPAHLKEAIAAVAPDPPPKVSRRRPPAGGRPGGNE